MARREKIVDDAPEITAEMFATMRPMKEAMPALAEAHKAARGRPKVENPKVVVSIRLSQAAQRRWIALGQKKRASLVTLLEQKIARTKPPKFTGASKTASQATRQRGA